MIPAPAKTPQMASIADLKDIAPPPPVSYMPQAPGWWVLLGILVLAMLVYGFVRWRRWRRDRYRREAQAELAVLERAVADPSTHAQAQVVQEVLAAPVAQRAGGQGLALFFEAAPQVGVIERGIRRDGARR